MGFRIFAAAILGDIDAIATELRAGDAELLLRKGNAKGATVMHVAAMHGHTKLVKWLADNHPRAQYVTECELHGRTPLHLAALNGKADVVIELLKLPGVDPMCVDANMYTPLLLAALHGHISVIMELLKGPNHQQLGQLTAAEAHGHTALHLAVRCAHVDTVRFLATKFAANQAIEQLTCKDHLGWTAVHSAAGTGRVDIVEEIFKMCSDSGVLGQQVINTGWSPLHVAAWLGHAEVVKMMRGKKGFGVNTTSDNLERLTPLHMTAHNGHDAVVDHLLRQDTLRVGDCDALRRTALHYAARQGHASVVSKLLSAWKSKSSGRSSLLVNATDVNGFTALHLAAREGHEQVVHILLEAKATVNAKTGSSLISKSLLDVVLSSHETIVDPMLLEADCWCISQMTPLHLATKNGHMAVVQELLKCCEVDIRALDGHGLMPHDWAEVREMKDFLELASRSAHETSAARVPKKKVQVLREEMFKWEKTVAAVRMPPSSFRSFQSMQYTTEAFEDMGKCGNSSDPRASNKPEKEHTTGEALHSTRGMHLHSTLYGGAPDTTAETVLQEIYEFAGQDEQSGNTALHVAVKRGHRKAVEVLLRHGPRDAVNVKNSEGHTPLALAFEKNHVDICKLILQNSEKVEDHLHDMLEKAMARNWLDMGVLLLGDARTRMGGSISVNLLDEASHSTEKKFLDILLRRTTIKDGVLQERREHMDSAGAMLVIAALIASITYQGVLQRPQGKHHWPLFFFDWFNAIAFYSAVATTIAVASGSLPIRHMYELVEAREPMRVSRGVSGVLLIISSACVVWAYAAAGFVETLDKKLFFYGNGLGAIVSTLFIVWFLKHYVQLYGPFCHSSHSRSNQHEYNEGHICRLLRRVAEILQKIPSMLSTQGNDEIQSPLFNSTAAAL